MITHTIPHRTSVFIIVMGLSAFNATTIFTVFLPFCENALQIPVTNGNQIFSVWLAVYFMTHIAAGYYGQRYFGYYRSITSGLILAFIGVFVISLQSLFNCYLGLALFSVGASLYSTNIFAAFGTQFQINDKQRSRAFLLLYIIMNLGAFLGDFASGFIITWLSYGWMFVIVSTPLLVAAFIFIFGAKFLQGSSERYANLGLLLFIIISSVVSPFLIMEMKSINILSILIFLVCIIYLVLKNKNSSMSYKRKAHIFLLYSFVILGYWGMYMLYPSVVEIYFEHHNQVRLWGSLIQPSTISSFSPFFLIIIGLTLMVILRKHRDTISMIQKKIIIGLTTMGIGFLVLFFGKNFYSHEYMFLLIVGLSYFFYAFSEILIGPINFAMVGVLIKPELIGTMLGFTYAVRSVGGILTGQLTTLAGNQYNHRVFMIYAGLALFLALLLLMTSRWIKE